MKYIIPLILTTLLYLVAANAKAAGPGIIYQADPYCNVWGAKCPITWMLNRTGKKKLARYAPNMSNSCDRGAMNVWIMGHPKNGIGFTNEDWQDLDIAVKKTGGWYRWGCCWSSDPTGTTCLN